MIPLRLQIKGFLSYHDPVDLSFDSFDLACISGSNGAGKSSLLDAITWVLFGEARRRDDTIINHQSNGAEVILDFDYENTHYRVQRGKIKDKSTTLEFFIQSAEGVWKPLTEAKVSATEERIKQTLKLDYETFTNASFFLQGKADQFSQQRPGDRKRILASILGLEIWERYKEESARRRRGVEIELANIEGVLAEIETELKEEQQRKIRLAALEKEYAVNKDLSDARKLVLDQQRLISDRLENEHRQVDKQTVEIKRLRVELDQQIEDLRVRQEERKNYRVQIEDEKQIRIEYERWQHLQKKLEEWESIAVNFRTFDAKRQEPLTQIASERAGMQTELTNLKNRQSEIEVLQSGLPTLNEQVEGVSKSVEANSERIARRSLLEIEKDELLAKKARLKAENAALDIEMKELKYRLTSLEAETGAKCPTCEKPLSSSEQQKLIDELKVRGKQRGDAHRDNVKEVENCERQFGEKEADLRELQKVDAELKQQHRLLDMKTEELRKNQAEIDKWTATGLKQFAALLTMLESDSYAQESRSEISVIDAELKKLGYDASAHENIRKLELETRTSQQKLNQLEQAKAALAPLEREIESLEKKIENNEMHLGGIEVEYKARNQKLLEDSKDSPEISVLEREYYQITEQTNKILTEVGYARNQVDVLEKQRAQKLVKQEEKGTLTTKIANLKILERAFGKDGIPALLIEQALPEIESHANEILDRLSYGGMSVKFETQREFKDKKRDDRRETLDILIRDTAGEREYELFSGGEAFRVNFAIRLALSRVLAHRSGARLQTLVIDEGFGSQDAEGRQRLIEAINQVRPDFAKILVITHLEELKDAFSARVEVTKTPSGSQVSVVAG